MPSTLQLIGKLIYETLGISVEYDHAGLSFKGKTNTPAAPVKKVSGLIKTWEGCQITFEIAAIPQEEKLLAGPILQTIVVNFPGVFAVRPSVMGATIFDRLPYPQSYAALNITFKIVKDFQQVWCVGERIPYHLTVKPQASELRGFFNGMIK